MAEKKITKRIFDEIKKTLAQSDKLLPLVMEKERLASFKTWRFGPRCRASAKKMCEAGFYQLDDGSNDSAACAFCGVHLESWESSDDPWEEHSTHTLNKAINCPFVALRKPQSEYSTDELKLLLLRRLDIFLEKSKKDLLIAFSQKKYRK